MKSVHADRRQAPVRRIWSAQSINSDDWGYRKVWERWISRLLTKDQEANRLAVCEKLLAR